VAAVTALFAHGGAFTPDAFAAHQVESGVFYGVEDATGALAAVGGTHIVDYTRAQLAAIGNMYTRPDCRGRGFASAVLGAIVASLQADGVTTIVLNVDHRNP
jgi:ribosomal protein S18 acetylase RimI-like enzyme